MSLYCSFLGGASDSAATVKAGVQLLIQALSSDSNIRDKMCVLVKTWLEGMRHISVLV